MSSSNGKQGPKVVHRTSNRVRVQLPKRLSKEQTDALVHDLKTSPEVRKVTLRGSSLIIEHSEGEDTMTFAGDALTKIFPNFERWSDEFDASIAKHAADPGINKTLPFVFLGLAAFRLVRDGALLAGESSFALAYIAFDLYWKFQQENVMHKIEQGMSQRQQEQLSA